MPRGVARLRRPWGWASGRAASGHSHWAPDHRPARPWFGCLHRRAVSEPTGREQCLGGLWLSRPGSRPAPRHAVRGFGSHRAKDAFGVHTRAQRHVLPALRGMMRNELSILQASPGSWPDPGSTLSSGSISDETPKHSILPESPNESRADSETSRRRNGTTLVSRDVTAT